MRRALMTLAAAATLLTAPPAAAAKPAALPSAVPVVGECYDLSDAQAAADYWPDADPVPCTEPHTYQVTESGLVPMDANAITFARDRCSDLDVWTATEVNASPAGIVEDPIRVESRSFYARPDRFVCGAVAVDYHGRADDTVVSLTSALDRLRPRAQAALRHCADAAAGRSAYAPPVTVPCTARPRWQVSAWILWSARYDANPGRSVLKQRAAELCGPGTVFSLPAASSWDDGLPRTWCYRKYP